jgi:hypothetical protein
VSSDETRYNPKHHSRDAWTRSCFRPSHLSTGAAGQSGSFPIKAGKNETKAAAFLNLLKGTRKEPQSKGCKTRNSKNQKKKNRIPTLILLPNKQRRAMAHAGDDAAVALRVREARELEKQIVEKIRKDGTFDTFRRRITDEVGQKARGRLRCIYQNFSPIVARCTIARTAHARPYYTPFSSHARSEPLHVESSEKPPQSTMTLRAVSDCLHGDHTGCLN